MPAESSNPALNEEFLTALVERVAMAVATKVYERLRAEVLLGDDALISEDELAAVFHKRPDAAATWSKIEVGPQFVRIAGSRKKHYRIGALRHYLSEVKAGAMHVTPFLDALAEIEKQWSRGMTAAE